MSKYEYVETAIWSDPTFEELGPHSKLVYLWSFTNPRCNLPGIYKTSVRQVTQETGVPTKRVEVALEELEGTHLLFFDGEWLFVRARVKYLHNPSPNTAKGIAKDIRKLDPCHPFTQAFLFLYAAQDDWLSEQLEEFDRPAANPLLGHRGEVPMESLEGTPGVFPTPNAPSTSYRGSGSRRGSGSFKAAPSKNSSPSSSVARDAA